MLPCSPHATTGTAGDSDRSRLVLPPSVPTILGHAQRTFLAVKQFSGLAITSAAVLLTVSLSLSTARREGLASVPRRHPAPAVEPNGGRPQQLAF